MKLSKGQITILVILFVFLLVCLFFLREEVTTMINARM